MRASAKIHNGYRVLVWGPDGQQDHKAHRNFEKSQKREAKAYARDQVYAGGAMLTQVQELIYSPDFPDRNFGKKVAEFDYKDITLKPGAEYFVVQNVRKYGLPFLIGDRVKIVSGEKGKYLVRAVDREAEGVVEQEMLTAEDPTPDVRRNPMQNPSLPKPWHPLTGYLKDGQLIGYGRQGQTKTLPWEHHDTVATGYGEDRHGQAVVLIYTGRKKPYYAAGYSLGEGMLFRGDVSGDDVDEARLAARSRASEWSERDAEDEEEFQREQDEEFSDDAEENPKAPVTVQKVLDFQLTHELIAYDRRAATSETKRGGRLNIHRLPLLLEAAGKVKDDMRGKGEDVPALVRSLHTHFEPGFSPIKKIVKQLGVPDAGTGDWWAKNPRKGPQRASSGLGDRFVEIMFDSYAHAALWSSTDESDESGGEPMDKNYSEEDIAEETLIEMRRDCEEFVRKAPALINASGLSAEQVGHDFWLTRNGHGAGFWDRGLGKIGDALTNAAKTFGSYDLYVGDDGMIYGSGSGARSNPGTRSKAGTTHHGGTGYTTCGDIDAANAGAKTLNQDKVTCGKCRIALARRYGKKNPSDEFAPTTPATLADGRTVYVPDVRIRQLAATHTAQPARGWSNGVVFEGGKPIGWIEIGDWKGEDEANRQVEAGLSHYASLRKYDLKRNPACSVCKGTSSSGRPCSACKGGVGRIATSLKVGDRVADISGKVTDSAWGKAVGTVVAINGYHVKVKWDSGAAAIVDYFSIGRIKGNPGGYSHREFETSSVTIPSMPIPQAVLSRQPRGTEPPEVQLACPQCQDTTAHTRKTKTFECDSCGLERHR